MRAKRLIFNKRHKLKTITMFVLFVIVLPILSIYMSDKIVYRLINPLYKRLEPADSAVVEVYEVPPLFYYEIYSYTPGISSNMHAINDDGLIACVFSKGDINIISNLFGNTKVTAKEKKIKGTTIPYGKNNLDRIKTLNSCVKDITSLVQKESRLSANILNGDVGEEKFAKDIKPINDIIKKMEKRYNNSSRVKEIVGLQDKAIDKLKISMMLNDGNSFHILQEAIYQSLNLYSGLIFESGQFN